MWPLRCCFQCGSDREAFPGKGASGNSIPVSQLQCVSRRAAPVITGDKPNELQFSQFGMTPSWAKKRMYLFNARSEGDGNKENDPAYTGGKGIISKPSFAEPIRSQRCLIIANAFIEGSTEEGLDKPYVVYLKDRRPFAMAGICRTLAQSGIWERSTFLRNHYNSTKYFVANDPAPPLARGLHQSDERRWLKAEHLNEITGMLEPYPADEMNAYPVSPAIKNPRNNNRELLDPVGERLLPESTTRIHNEIKLQGMGSGKRENR